MKLSLALAVALAWVAAPASAQQRIVLKCNGDAFSEDGSTHKQALVQDSTTYYAIAANSIKSMTVWSASWSPNYCALQGLRCEITDSYFAVHGNVVMKGGVTGALIDISISRKTGKVSELNKQPNGTALTFSGVCSPSADPEEGPNRF